MGVQCMIFSPTREFFLIGVRRKDQSYRPRHKAIPGGMLEERDAHIPPRVSLMREIYEETRLSLERDVNLVAILREQSFLSTMLLLEAHLDEDSGFSPEQQIDGGDEWEGKLKWISLTELKKMTRSNLMEGLVYYHSKL